jgi:hypothetical protein
LRPADARGPAPPAVRAQRFFELLMSLGSCHGTVLQGSSAPGADG